MSFSGTLTKSLERGTRLPSEVLCPTHLSILALPSALINGLGAGHRMVLCEPSFSLHHRDYDRDSYRDSYRESSRRW